MQEVSGSSPLSSTGQKLNSNGSNSEYSSKATAAGWPPYVCSDRACSRATVAGRAPDSRRWTSVGQPVTWANTCLIGPVTFATRSPSDPPAGPFLPAAVAAFASGLAALGVPTGAIHYREPRHLAGTARSQTAGAARGLSAWCRWRLPGAGRAGALRRLGAGCAVAEPDAPVGALVGQMTNQARGGARAWPGAGRWVACPGFDAADVRSSPPPTAGWRRTAALRMPRRSLAANGGIQAVIAADLYTRRERHAHRLIHG